jgi:formylglycine-generating enzyme required for sulfatase activity
MNQNSRNMARTLSQWLIAAVAASVFVCGLFWQNAVLLGVGAVILCMVLQRAWTVADAQSPATSDARAERRKREPARTPRTIQEDLNFEPTSGEQTSFDGLPRQNHQPKTTDGLVDELLADGRYALMLRSETKRHLTQHQVLRAIRQLDEAMALVPAGRVLVGHLAELSNSSCGQADVDPKLTQRNLVMVLPVYLDRHCVTNAEYQRFVDAGGYEQLEFWHEEALPALLDFVDQTGAPGPRYWSDGQYPSDDHRLPVVGISWFEAWAYARWVGKQLPNDAEWTKAAAWPVESAPGRVAQRRYPWGESFDVRRAHLYGSGHSAPVAVDEFPSGMSVGGIHQLIGNVWEWTATPLTEVGDTTLHVSESVMSIRGGAFDTYFENQATCHFQSGEHALSRRRNIGFRLALPMSDLETTSDTTPEAPVSEPVEPEEISPEPVLASN